MIATNSSKIHIMHAKGVYIMPPLAVVQKTVFAKYYVSEKSDIMYRLRRHYVSRFCETFFYKDKDTSTALRLLSMKHK